MSRKLMSLMGAALLSFVATVVLFATPIPVLDVQQLIDEADLIVVGNVQKLEDRGNTTVDLSGQRIPARSFVAAIVADRVLKGSADAATVQVRFAVTNVPTGQRRITPDMYALFFLKSAGAGYSLVSPYYPSVPAVPVAALDGATPSDRVANVLAAVIDAAGADPRIKITTVHALKTVKSSTAVEALRKTLSRAEGDLRLSASAALLELNDITGLQVAEDALLSESGPRNEILAHNLRYGISVLSDPNAIPSLARLLKSADERTRRAAASALRRVRSAETTSILAAALDDADWEVRYYAVIALAEIAGENAWRPDMDTFRRSEAKYLAYWKDRSRRNR